MDSTERLIRTRIRKEMSDIMDEAARNGAKFNAYAYAEKRYLAMKEPDSEHEYEFVKDRFDLGQARERLMWALPKLIATVDRLNWAIESDKDPTDLLHAESSFEAAMRDIHSAYALAVGDNHED